jgi:hypothetical protein
MNNIEQFTEFYKSDFSGTYHSTDRLVLNGYYNMGCTLGGFRHFWRQLEGGDETLDENHVRRYAGRFSHRIRKFAPANNIPLIYTDKKTVKRKDEISAEYLPEDPNFTGLFCIIAGKASAPLIKVRRFGKKGIELSKEMLFRLFFQMLLLYHADLMREMW